jgi:tripartite-type tricarboxylate transporter receptor subunit TctC
MQTSATMGAATAGRGRPAWPRAAGRLLVGAIAALAAHGVCAQAAAWPDKPVRIIIPFAPGGPPDTIARLLSPKLTEILGQPMVIENRTGAGGNIGTVAVAKSPADGYTVLITSSAYAVNTSFPDSGYSAERDFAPVTIVAAQPNVVVAHPGLPVKTLTEFIAYARTRKLAFSSPGSGTTPHLTGENLFNIAAKLGIPAAHFRGAGPAVTAVLGGEPPVGVMAMTAPLPHIRAGKLRALAVSSARRIASLPDVPTLVESGYPDMLDYTWVGVFMPAGTPAAAVNRLYDAMQRVLQTPDIKERVAGLAFDPITEPPARTVEYVKSEVVRWGEVVRKSGVKPE